MFNFIKNFFTSNSIKNYDENERIKKELSIKPIESTLIVKNTQNSIDIKSNETSIKSSPLPKEANKCIPTKNGLYPHEILLLEYASTFKTTDKSFQKFWEYQYGIKDISFYLDSLIEKGFITIGTIENTLKYESISNLKKQLKLFSLKVSGNKEILVDRLLSNVDSNYLESIFPDKYYQLSPLGQSELSENNYIIHIHKNNLADLDIWKANIIANNKNLPLYDNIWEYLNRYSLKYYSKKDFGLYRNSRLDMALFLSNEKKYKHALAMISEVIFYDLNSFNYNYSTLEKDFNLEDFLAIRIPSGIISLANTYIENSKLSNIEVENIMLDRMNTLSIPVIFFNPEECISIFFKELEVDFNSINFILSNVYSRYKNK